MLAIDLLLLQGATGQVINVAAKTQRYRGNQGLIDQHFKKKVRISKFGTVSRFDFFCTENIMSLKRRKRRR